MMRKTKKVMALTLAVCMALTNSPVMASQDFSTGTKSNTAKSSSYAEGEAIIMYRNSTISANSRTDSILSGDMEIVDTYVFEQNTSDVKSKSATTDTNISVSLVKSDKYSTEELISRLSKNSNVKYAEPNYKIKKADSNDSYYKYLWGQDNKGQNNGTEGLDINADTPLLADKDSKERVIALIDTGIDYTHEDLKDVVWNNPYNNKKLLGEHGYDFINLDADPLDDNGHGSHCSGIMAGKSNNGVGVAGTSKSDNVKIMALKILDEDGYGFGMEAVGAYNYIYKAQQLGINVVAVNNSWGGADDEESEIMKTLINMVGEKGAISVCAAGNDGSDNDYSYTMPANIDSEYVISVAASNEKDELAAFSNYGKERVDIAAPGADILSSVSYNCFNPSIYEDTDALCSTYQSFDEDSPVKTIDESGKPEMAAGENEIAYGISTSDSGEMSVETSGEEYFGEKSLNDKSLKWTVKGAEKDGMYYLILPYEIKESTTPTDVSMMVKVSGPSREESEMDWLFGGFSMLYLADMKLGSNGTYDITDIEDEIFNGTYIDEGNYWSHLSGTVAEKTKKQEKHALVVCVFAAADGDYTVYIDDLGISKENVSSEKFGKYDYYNGTSMATPHVTGAIAAVANAYPNDTALQVKARVLGSTRTNAGLADKMVTGGVLDLSKVDNPNMTIEKVALNSKNQIEIKGYYADGAEVYVNGKKTNIISNDGKTILIDGKAYTNKEITVKLVKDDQTYEKECFFAIGKAFTAGPSIDGELNGGQMLSDGGELVYISNAGGVSYGTPYKDEDTGKEEIYWSEGYLGFTTEAFGSSYTNVVDYDIYNDTDYVYTNGVVYGSLSIDVGYAADRILAYFDKEEGWRKLTDIPADMYDLTGTILATYNGDLYLIGGVDENGNFVKTVKKYSISSKKWTNVSSIPESRAYSKAVQVGKKLVITLGTDGTNNIPKNIIFDGSKWTMSKASLSKSIDTKTVEMGDKKFAVTTGEIGIIKNGIIYTDLRVDNLGDTFTYNLEKDTFATSGYALNSYNLYYDNLFAVTVQDKLYVVYGEEYDYDDDDDEFWSVTNMADDYPTNDEYQGAISTLCIPVSTGYVNVVDTSEFGAYVDGAGYYLPGDTITLKAQILDEEMVIQKFVVNGKSVAKGKNGYVYTAKAYNCPAQITAQVIADYDFGEIVVPKPGKTVVSKAVRAKNNKSVKLTLKKIKTATGYQIKYSTSKKFKKKVTKTITSKKVKVTLKKLKPKKKYYVKARAYISFNGSKTYGTWSKVKTVKVKKK